MKDGQYNGQKKKDKMKNNALQNITQKTKWWATWSSLKPDVNAGAPNGWAVPDPLVTCLNHILILDYIVLILSCCKSLYILAVKAGVTLAICSWHFCCTSGNPIIYNNDQSSVEAVVSVPSANRSAIMQNNSPPIDYKRQ
jgi:hypothetical protein